jgi:hypothetical protein
MINWKHSWAEAVHFNLARLPSTRLPYSSVVGGSLEQHQLI